MILALTRLLVLQEQLNLVAGPLPHGDGFNSTTTRFSWVTEVRITLFYSNVNYTNYLIMIGMQHWGERSEIIRFELHDVSLAMNVFGTVCFIITIII